MIKSDSSMLTLTDVCTSATRIVTQLWRHRRLPRQTLPCGRVYRMCREHQPSLTYTSRESPNWVQDSVKTMSMEPLILFPGNGNWIYSFKNDVHHLPGLFRGFLEEFSISWILLCVRQWGIWYKIWFHPGMRKIHRKEIWSRIGRNTDRALTLRDSIVWKRKMSFFFFF